MPGGREDELDRLYGLPLDEFTAARNALARELKQSGDADAAEQVRALAKPSVPAWAVNQLPRREPKALKELLDAGAGVRKAQQRALAGKGSGDELRSAQASERAAVQALTRSAGEILDEAGRTASRAVLDRIAATLRAAAVSDGGREALRSGRLTEEVEAGGFELLAGLGATAGAAPSGQRDELAERRRAKEERRQRKRELQAAARELAKAAGEAEREADDAEATAEGARRRADEARAEADRAAQELADFED